MVPESILHHESSVMSKPDLNQIAPLDRSTEESARLNLEIANQERAEIGLPPQPRLVTDAEFADLRLMAQCSVRMFPRLHPPIPPRVLSVAQTEALQDKVDELVERYGYSAAVYKAFELLGEYGHAAVSRALRLVAAANGLES